MAYVVTSPCIGTKDGACAKVCPCECFHNAGEMLVIDPAHCIDCGLCAPECPVGAIFFEEDVPEIDRFYIERNRAFFDGKSTEEKDRLRVV